MTKAEVMEQKRKSNEFDFEKDLSINKFKLDEECLSHSSLYFRYAEASREAKSEVSKQKNNLELVEAQRREEIRIELEKKGIKPTIPMLDSAVIRDEEVVKCKELVRKAEDICAKLSVAVTAMEHRKSELDNLVKLYCAGYFSVVANSDSRKFATEQTEKEIRKNLNHKE